MKVNSKFTYIISFLIILLLLSAFTGCKRNGDSSSLNKESDEESKQVNELCSKNLMEAIYRSNRLDELLLDYDSVEQDTDFFDKEGKKIYDFYSYGDKNIFFLEDNLGFRVVFFDGKRYRYSNDSSNPSIDMIESDNINDIYSKTKNNMIFTPIKKEEIIGAAQNGNEYLVTTRIPADILAKELMNSEKRKVFTKYVESLEPEDSCIVEYHLTPFLYEIVKRDIYIVKKNGERYLFLKTKVNHNVSRPGEINTFIN